MMTISIIIYLVWLTANSKSTGSMKSYDDASCSKPQCRANLRFLVVHI